MRVQLILRCLALTALALFTGCANPSRFETPAPAISVYQPLTNEPSSALTFLKDGGYVLVMRHGKSPHDQSDARARSPDCRLGDGRGLSNAGVLEGMQSAGILQTNNIPLGAIFSSEMCRAFDTALQFAGLAPVTANAALVTTAPDDIAAFKAELEGILAASPGTNILLVSHSNIAPLYGARGLPGEGELPEGVISVVSPKSWYGLENGTVFRIGPDFISVAEVD